ncbi:uncharacterized protein EI90DRAFT_3040589 [Cantharellus anzutake]|uniref:uncharacterized protein n=1 Tax=Cantharellus anzutake TaxID=1750568 RepID=UPI001908B73F|nr:uncharacterized protein EI90DRAFT_3040589 [Cantharellus anzutake]KAF8339142.1 hypothetical protein EI90DRAFT_3040589 [Cantharellus anzutake]
MVHLFLVRIQVCVMIKVICAAACRRSLAWPQDTALQDQSSVLPHLMLCIEERIRRCWYNWGTLLSRCGVVLNGTTDLGRNVSNAPLPEYVGWFDSGTTPLDNLELGLPDT